jgi:ABC-type Mn2+/Zn2+ transport system permease subunit
MKRSEGVLHVVCLLCAIAAAATLFARGIQDSAWTIAILAGAICSAIGAWSFAQQRSRWLFRAWWLAFVSGYLLAFVPQVYYFGTI